MAEVKELLCVIVDFDTEAWARAENQLGLKLENELDQIIIFCNSHLAIRHENEVVVVGCTSGQSRLLYSSILTKQKSISSGKGDSKNANIKSNSSSNYQPFRLARDGIVEGVKSLMADGNVGKPIPLSRAMALALCHMNKEYPGETTSTQGTLGAKAKANGSSGEVLKRFLIITVSDDDSSQYVPVMDCIFAAQKFKVVIDVCKVLGDAKGFLEQASYLTGGIYLALEQPKGLLQYLMVTFLPSITARRQMQLPSQEHVDLRSTCFCHHNVVDQAYICSVCLSIYCRPIPVCSTCGTKFPMTTLKRYLNVLKIPKVTPAKAQGNASPATVSAKANS